MVVVACKDWEHVVGCSPACEESWETANWPERVGDGCVLGSYMAAPGSLLPCSVLGLL